MGNSQLKSRRETLIEEEEEEEEEEFTCAICTEKTPKRKKFENKKLCKHPYCQNCIAKYIESKIKGENTAKIKCPGLDCKQLIDTLCCKQIIPTSLFSKWCDLLFDDYVLGFERSFCPNKSCMALIVNECEKIGKVKKAQCPNCNQWLCSQCKLKWHARYQCEESGNLRDRNDIVFGQLVEKMNWARCPTCGHCVERNNGCRAMLCRCNTSFCYSCGGTIPYGCQCFPRLIGHTNERRPQLLILSFLFPALLITLLSLFGYI